MKMLRIDLKNKLSKKKKEFAKRTLHHHPHRPPVKMNKKFNSKITNQQQESTKPTLPVTAARERFIEEFKKNDVLIVLGETACGKTTQLPQYLYDEGLIIKGTHIAVTQPRRVAAISIASRVAFERGEELCTNVGYSVRFNEKYSKTESNIKYITDGMLLHESMFSPQLLNYSTVFIDEAHERTLNSDILLSILKKAQEERGTDLNSDNWLKIVIMSATMDADHFLNYFPNSKAVYIEGRQHQVETFFQTNEANYFTSISLNLYRLHVERPLDEHILVFLTGQEEICALVASLKENSPSNVEIHPLYSSLSDKAQLRALCPPSQGVRKIVISTNVAETSLTIPGIRIVLDSGMVKRKNFSPTLGVETLCLERITKAEAQQRAGRAGRVGGGKCYRFYRREDYEEMEEFIEPEILRVNLASVLLRLAYMGHSKPTQFDWISPPSPQKVEAGVSELVSLNAVELRKGKVRVTELGQLIAKAPLDPQLGCILAHSPSHNLVKPICAILAMLSTDPVWERRGEREESDLRSEFHSPDGDLVTYFNLLTAFGKTKDKKAFRKKYRLNLRALNFALRIKLQLIRFIKTHFPSPPLTYNSETLSEDVRKLFYASIPSNVATLRGGKYYIGGGGGVTIGGGGGARGRIPIGQNRGGVNIGKGNSIGRDGGGGAKIGGGASISRDGGGGGISIGRNRGGGGANIGGGVSDGKNKGGGGGEEDSANTPLEASIHPASSLCGRRVEVVHFIQVVQIEDKNYLVGCSKIDPTWPRSL